MSSNVKMTSTNLSCNLLLGVGNPILDIIVTVDKEFLEQNSLREDDAVVADHTHEPIFKALKNFDPLYLAGGSVYNTLKIIQWLLEKPKATTYIGCIGTDEYGKIIEDEGFKSGIDVRFEKIAGKTSTCAVLVTNEHRTLCTKVEASKLFSENYINNNWNVVEAARYYYCVGYSLPNNLTLIKTIAKHAAYNKKKFLMNMSAEYICRNFTGNFLEVFPCIDVIFGNEREALALADGIRLKNSSLSDIIVKLCQLPKENNSSSRICIVTRGNRSVLYCHENSLKELPIINVPAEKIVDTNGAGDAFVGGFLSEYVKGTDIENCIKCGIWAASQVVQSSGCTFGSTARL